MARAHDERETEKEVFLGNELQRKHFLQVANAMVVLRSKNTVLQAHLTFSKIHV
jgi:hypothetical protein